MFNILKVKDKIGTIPELRWKNVNDQPVKRKKNVYYADLYDIN